MTTVRRLLLIHTLSVLLAVGLFFLLPSLWRDEIPESVLQFERVKHFTYDSAFNLNLCTLLKHTEASFFASPKDLEPSSCDLSKVILAYKGWCRAGIEDVHPHFSQPYMPYVQIEHHGSWTVIYAQNYLKSHAKPSRALQDKALTALKTLSPAFVNDVRIPENKALFLGADDAIPLRTRKDTLSPNGL